MNLLRSGTIVSSTKNLCNFFAKSVLMERSHRGNQTMRSMVRDGVYWDQFHEEKLYPHPYVDVDMKLPSSWSGSFGDYFDFVSRGLQFARDRFRSLGGGDQSDQMSIFFCKRDVPSDGKNESYVKVSFHVHWPGLICASTTALGFIINEINALGANMPVVGDDGKLTASSDFLFDRAVYSVKHQLFRLPFCGKNGDMSACLLPIDVTSVDGVWEMSLVECEDVETIADWVNNSRTHTNDPRKYIMLEISEGAPPPLSSVPLMSESGVRPVLATDEEDQRWMSFMGPIMTKFVLPNWVRYRQSEMRRLNVSARVPDHRNVEIRSVKRLLGYPASFRYEPVGDCFCEHDTGSTPYTHRAGAVSYIVDFLHGKIAQQCVKCRTVDRLKWHNFIQRGAMSFRILSPLEESVRGDDYISLRDQNDGASFFLKYCSDDVLYCKETKTVMVYDSECGLWKSGTDANRCVLRLVDEMNEAYCTYMCSRVHAIMQRQEDELLAMGLPADVHASRLQKIHKSAQVAYDKLPKKVWNLTLASREGLWKKMKFEDCPHTVERMEPYDHLIPLLDCRALDVFTWTVIDIRKDHYFTSCLNGNIIDFEDETVTDFINWQRNVCCGDEEYLKWKLQVMGLSLTLFNFDRSFYMPLGTSGRNGKSSEVFMFNLVTMCVTPHRGFNMGREYLTKCSQDRKSANAPDTVLIELANKTCVIVDECRETKLDGPLIKTLVSGDRTSARNLYESEMTPVRNRGSLWLVTNKTLIFDYGDSALMNRIRIMPYRAEWVRDVAAERKKKSDIRDQMFIFKEDAMFKEKCLSNWGNAMVTVCLRALHDFFRSLPRDPADPTRPLKMVSFDIPKAVREFTQATIEAEHPLLSFSKTYMAKCDEKHQEEVSVDTLFMNYRVFARNENARGLKFVSKCQFVEALRKMDMVVVRRGDDEAQFVSGYYLKREVPNNERVDVPSYYVPPPCVSGEKRSYDVMMESGSVMEE